MFDEKEWEEYFSYIDNGLCPNCHQPVVEEGQSWFCHNCDIHGHITIDRYRQLREELGEEIFKKEFGEKLNTFLLTKRWDEIKKKWVNDGK